MQKHLNFIKSYRYVTMNKKYRLMFSDLIFFTSSWCQEFVDHMNKKNTIMGNGRIGKESKDIIWKCCHYT